MSKDNKSIHEFDFNLICEYFSKMERQGPGSSEVTIKALSFIDNLTSESHIADMVAVPPVAEQRRRVQQLRDQQESIKEEVASVTRQLGLLASGVRP